MATAVGNASTTGAVMDGKHDSVGDEATIATRRSIPMRVLDEYEFRDKFEETRVVSPHGSKPSMVLVVGKARKLEGDGEDGDPRELLGRALVPRETPPHALKLVDVNDWTIRYGEDEPEIWLVTPRAWYKLLDPSPRYEKYATVMLRRARFTNAVVKALMKNWNMGLDEGLDRILSVPVVKHDVPMAIKTPSKAARLLGDTTAEAQKQAALDGLSEEQGNEPEFCAYTHADIVGDGFFIVSQLDSLLKSKALLPPSDGDEESSPIFITELQTWTSEKLQFSIAPKMSRLERDRARRERLRVEKLAEDGIKNEPRDPRLEPPPPASHILPDYAHIGPALQTELLTLWDFAQVFAQALQIPQCPLERFAKAFFGTEPGAAEAALLRDFMVSCLRLVEGRIDSIDHETAKVTPSCARWWDAPILGIHDVEELDWQSRAHHYILEFQSSINDRMRVPAMEAGTRLEQGEAVETLTPVQRVALAVALSSSAVESESMRFYFTEVFDHARERRKAGKFHTKPPTLVTEVPKPAEVKEKDNSLKHDGTSDVEMDEFMEDEPAKPLSLTELRREQLMQFRRGAVDRAVLSRGKPVAVDEQGRRYFALGGSNNAGRLFVQTAPPGWHEDEEAPAVEDNSDEPKQPMAGPPVDDIPFTVEAMHNPTNSSDVSGLVEYASRWGVYKPGSELDALSSWCNPAYDNERYITKLHRLISYSIDGVECDGVELDEKTRLERIENLCASMSTDGYSNLDDVALTSCNDHTLTLKLLHAIKFVLQSAPFWRTGDMRWIDRFLKVSAYIEGLLSATDPSLIDVCKILPGVESVCANAGLMDEATWPEVKPTWLAQIRFHVLGRRTEAELAGTASTTDVPENSIPGMYDISTAPELLEPLGPLTVHRAANLVNQFLRFLAQDSNRMSQASFKRYTGLTHGAAAINTGDVVALIRRGLSKTYARYIDKKSRPRTWIDVNTLRVVERCVVVGAAYRGTEIAPKSQHAEDRPPCTWLMLQLLDGPESSLFPSTRRQSAEGTAAPEVKDTRRLVVAPLIVGDIADYVLPWSKYNEDKTWQVGQRIMMQFEGIDAEDESRGIIQIDGNFYYLGRVRKTRSSPDKWETVMIVFDSDPEDHMWVSPWEIIEAPEKYHDPVHEGPGLVDVEKSLSAEDMLQIAKCKAVSRRLGWPKGESKKEFDDLRAKIFGIDPPRAPIFCGVPMNLHRVFIESMHLGGYEHVTRRKLWKTVARTLGRDLTSQTSASFAMRKAYERCLYPMETSLTSDDMFGQLGLTVDSDANIDQFPGSTPGANSDDDDYHDDSEYPVLDNEGDKPRDDENEMIDDSMEVDTAKEKSAHADDYKMSDDDFDEDADSDEGESDSDFAPGRKPRQ